MYCTTAQVQQLLPDNIQIGEQNLGTAYSPSNLSYPGMPAPSAGLPQNKNVLTPREMRKYIHYAAQQIDSRLRSFYSCPLRKIKTHETRILKDVSSGTNVGIYVHDTGGFSEFDYIRITDGNNNELIELASVDSLTRMTAILVNNNYTVGTYSLLSVVEYPDPIPIICARLAASYLYDELFSAEQSPTISEYGKEQRRLAGNSLDSVLDGTIKLFGQEHTGRRFIRGSLFDAYNAPTKDFQFGREKS